MLFAVTVARSAWRLVDMDIEFWVGLGGEGDAVATVEEGDDEDEADGDLRVLWGGDLEEVGLLIDGRQGFAEKVIGL